MYITCISKHIVNAKTCLSIYLYEYLMFISYYTNTKGSSLHMDHWRGFTSCIV
jgi:hypothetical protein